MSEEQQAVLDESQGGVIESQANENEGAPLETPAESAPAEDTTEADGVQKRINKLTAEKYAKDRKILELEGKLNAAPIAPESQDTQGEPTLEQFDYDEDKYRSALIKHQVKQEVSAAKTEAQKEQTQQSANQREKAFTDREVKYATDNPEYFTDIQAMPQFETDTLNVIIGQENAPELFHHLAKNPELAVNIATLDPYNAAVQVGVISAKLSAIPKTVVQTSTAPEPIEPISSGGALSSELSSHAKGATFE